MGDFLLGCRSTDWRLGIWDAQPVQRAMRRVWFFIVALYHLGIVYLSFLSAYYLLYTLLLRLMLWIKLYARDLKRKCDLDWRILSWGLHFTIVMPLRI